MSALTRKTEYAGIKSILTDLARNWPVESKMKDDRERALGIAHKHGARGRSLVKQRCFREQDLHSLADTAKKVPPVAGAFRKGAEISEEPKVSHSRRKTTFGRLMGWTLGYGT